MGYDNDYLRQWKIVWLYFHKNYNLELLIYFLKNTPLPAASPSSFITKGGLNFSMKPNASFLEFART